MGQSYRELLVWKKSVQLVKALYLATTKFPSDELYGLRSQMRRAAVSIPSNIAEGQSRLTKGEFVNFLSIARGSNAEVRSQLTLARHLGFGDQMQITRCETQATQISKMLNGLIVSLKSTKVPSRP